MSLLLRFAIFAIVNNTQISAVGLLANRLEASVTLKLAPWKPYKILICPFMYDGNYNLFGINTHMYEFDDTQNTPLLSSRCANLTRIY